MNKKQLPKLMIVTQHNLMRPVFLDALSQAVAGGARLVQLREKAMARDEISDLAREAKAICDAHGAQLFVNGDLEIARAIATGVHLPEAQSVAQARRALGWEYSVGQSAHSLSAALRAQDEGADYIIFGSVFATASHAGSTPQGIAALREIAREISIPVFAIGGISCENCRQCLENGAHGVAVMRAIWQAENVAQAVMKFNMVLQA
jgi:thiamine-phosphate pyrophosphorylase